MNKPKNDTQVSTHLHYHWWKYILLIVISIAVWTSVFDMLAKPEKNEQVGIVLFGDGLDVPALHADLWAAKDSLTQQKITLIDVSQTFADYEHLGAILMARAYDCDLLILSADQMDMLSAYGFFMPLPDRWQDIPKYSQEKDGTPTAYGLEIYSPGSQNRFSTFCSGEQTYYVFLSKESVNLAGLNGIGNTTDDAALRILEYLLEESYGSTPKN